MNVLAFDTCFGAVSVAVRSTSGTLTIAYEARTAGHAERLLPMIDQTMRSAGLAFRDIDRIAVTVGPGSFTGVRVGVAAARALALATGKPVVGMTSLAVMADEARAQLGNAYGERPLAVAVDARRGMVYVQIFDAAQDTSAPLLLEPADAAAIIGGGPAILVGSAAAAVASLVAAAGGKAEAALADLQPHARVLALRAGELVPAAPIRPLYLRIPDAKLQSDKSLPRVVS